MTRRMSMACCLVVLPVLGLSAAPVLAAAPASSSGSGTYTFIPDGPPRFAGGNVIVDATLKGTIVGTLSGTWAEQAVETIHPDGSATTHASGVFTVLTSCGAGSFPFELEAQQPSATASLSGRFRSIDASDATLGIHTVDVFTTSPNSGVFSYAGSYSC